MTKVPSERPTSLIDRVPDVDQLTIDQLYELYSDLTRTFNLHLEDERDIKEFRALHIYTRFIMEEIDRREQPAREADQSKAGLR